MREEFVVIGAVLLIGALVPAAAAHWGTGEGRGTITDGVSGRVTGGGVVVVDTGGVPATGTHLMSCDREVGGPGDQWAASDEAEVDENPNPVLPNMPDNLVNDGGSTGACHSSSYALSDFNTEGCGEAPDHGYANANPLVSPIAPVFLIVGCDLGTTGGGQVNPTGAVTMSYCVVKEVTWGTPGDFVHCLDPLTDPTTGFSNCQQDGTADRGEFGYPSKTRDGVRVPTKTETQNGWTGGLDCSGTDGSTDIFVFLAVDLNEQQVSGPATSVWTTD